MALDTPGHSLSRVPPADIPPSPERSEGGTVVGASPPVLRLLVAYRQRIRRQRRRLYLCVAAVGVGLTWLTVSVAYYLDALPANVVVAALLLCLVLLPAALALEALRRPSLESTARTLDRLLDDRQRLLTAVELLPKAEHSPLERAQLATTALLASRRQEALVPARAVWPEAALAGGLLAVAVGILLLKAVAGNFTPYEAGPLPGEQQVAAVPSPTPQSGLPDSERQPEEGQQDMQEQTTGQGEQGQQGDQPGSDALAQAEASRRAEDALRRLAQALGEQSVTQQAADSLRKGEYGQAADQLGQVGTESDQISDPARRALAESLERAAQDEATTDALREAEQNAARALRRGDYRQIEQAMRELGDAVRRAAGDIVPQQELAERFPQTAPTPESRQAQGDQSGQGGQIPVPQYGQNGQQASGGGSGQQSADEVWEQGDQSTQGEQGEQGGQGQDGQSGQQGQDGQGGAGSGAGRGQSRVTGPADSRDLGVQGNPFELEGRPDPNNRTPTDQPPDANRRPGLTIEGDAGPGEATPLEPGGPVTATGESNRLPVERWGVVQRYFSGDR